MWHVAGDDAELADAHGRKLRILGEVHMYPEPSAFTTLMDLTNYDMLSLPARSSDACVQVETAALTNSWS